jgi:hypothetical protein
MNNLNLQQHQQQMQNLNLLVNPNQTNTVILNDQQFHHYQQQQQQQQPQPNQQYVLSHMPLSSNNPTLSSSALNQNNMQNGIGNNMLALPANANINHQQPQQHHMHNQNSQIFVQSNGNMQPQQPQLQNNSIIIQNLNSSPPNNQIGSANLLNNTISNLISTDFDFLNDCTNSLALDKK